MNFSDYLREREIEATSWQAVEVDDDTPAPEKKGGWLIAKTRRYRAKITLPPVAG